MGVSSALGSSALLPAGLGFRNIIINGAMQVAQRGISSAGLTSGEAIRTVDRFVSAFGTAGTWTETQSTDGPPGFGYSRKFECTTANTSLSAGSYLLWGQNVEGLNLQQFAKGTSSAKPFTFSFWVKAFQTGTYVVELYDNNNSRQVTKTFTINASATWEYKTIQFPADATGVFANNNTSQLSVFFWLVAGTNFTSGTATGSWATVSNSNRAVGLTVNGASSTSNYFQFTGLQLEQNTQPTPFEQRPIGVELALCQRYYWRTIDSQGFGLIMMGGVEATTSAAVGGGLPVTMRATPSIALGPGIRFFSSASQTIVPTISGQRSSSSFASLALNITSGTIGQAGYLYNNPAANSYIEFSCEL